MTTRQSKVHLLRIVFKKTAKQESFTSSYRASVVASSISCEKRFAIKLDQDGWFK